MFSPGTHNVSFIFRGMNAGPHNFLCCCGWVPLPVQEASGSLFLLNLTHFS